MREQAWLHFLGAFAMLAAPLITMQAAFSDPEAAYDLWAALRGIHGDASALPIIGPAIARLSPTALYGALHGIWAATHFHRGVLALGR
jgi:hypothetical protein